MHFVTETAKLAELQRTNLNNILYFELADEYLQQLGREVAQELAIEAARVHFNSAASAKRPEMAMAQKWYVSLQEFCIIVTKLA